jgi:HNH endonuclease
MGTSKFARRASEAIGAVESATVAGHASPDDQSAWRRAHTALTRLARRRALLDAEEGRCLLTALRAATHVHLGFGTFAEYVERSLGYSPRSTHEKLRVAEALERLPALARALDEGALTWSALRELTRVANGDTEHEWLEFSRGKTVRQLEHVIAHARPGDGPDSPRTPGPRRHVLRFEVTPETFALFREASAHLRRHGDRAFDDDALLLAMARAVLGGPTDDGRASYQVSLQVCSECGRAEQRAKGTSIEVGSEIAAMACCDAQHIGCVDGIDNVAAPANDNPRAADTDVPDVDALRAAAAVSAHADPRARRAKQTIPPAVRRAILQRDHHRCGVPGCRNAVFLDIHHIVPRSEGGSNDPANLHSICGAHHRAVHRGQLVIERDASGVRFLHADGRPYGEIRPTLDPARPSRDTLDPQTRDIEKKVASALHHLGFRAADIRATLTDLRRREREANTATADAPSITPTEHLLRQALARLAPSRSARR